MVNYSVSGTGLLDLCMSYVRLCIVLRREVWRVSQTSSMFHVLALGPWTLWRCTTNTDKMYLPGVEGEKKVRTKGWLERSHTRREEIWKGKKRDEDTGYLSSLILSQIAAPRRCKLLECWTVEKTTTAKKKKNTPKPSLKLDYQSTTGLKCTHTHIHTLKNRFSDPKIRFRKENTARNSAVSMYHFCKTHP